MERQSWSEVPWKRDLRTEEGTKAERVQLLCHQVGKRRGPSPGDPCSRLASDPAKGGCSHLLPPKKLRQREQGGVRLSLLGLKASLLGDGDSARGLGSGLVLSGAPTTDAEVPAPPGCTPGLEPRAGLLRGRRRAGRQVLESGGWTSQAAWPPLFRSIWLCFSLGNEDF